MHQCQTQDYAMHIYLHFTDSIQSHHRIYHVLLLNGPLKVCMRWLSNFQILEQLIPCLSSIPDFQQCFPRKYENAFDKHSQAWLAHNKGYSKPDQRKVMMRTLYSFVTRHRPLLLCLGFANIWRSIPWGRRMDEQWEERRQPLVRVTRILEQTADGRHVTLRLQFWKD